MAQFNDIVGAVMKKLKDVGVDENTIGSLENFGWFQYEFWHFVLTQQEVAKRAKSALEYPPMQTGASFQPRSPEGKYRGSNEGARSRRAVIEVST